MAVEKETQLEVWLEENMPEPSGGNPNYVETITGTLANPWGSVNPTELCADIADKNASLIVTLTLPGYGPLPLAVQAFPADGQIVASVFNNAGTVDVTNASAIRLTLNTGYSTYALVALTGGAIADYSGLMDTAQTTLTIIHHPLPEN